jgi:PEP-CTERM motif
MKRKNMKFTILATVASASGLMLGGAHSARASILAGSFDTIYADNFAAPAVNVNAAATDPNSIAGNAPATSTGLDGGTAAATYIGSAAQPGTLPDAVWNYSGSNTATITSPTTPTTEDASTIDNLTLPLVPVVGEVYDLELTMTAPAATGGHGLEMAFLFNNGNGHNAQTGQAISNNDPVGLILDRDATSSGTTANYFEIFESTGTGADNSFAPSASALTGGTPGTTITVDALFTPTGATTGTMSWYLNGVLANSTPVAVTGLTGGISDIQFGDNRDGSSTFSNFSLTAQAVPEPASFGVLAIGGLAALRRRRSSAK